MDNSPESDPLHPGTNLVRFATVMLVLIGIAAGLGFFMGMERNDAAGVGACLTAGAIAFGTIVLTAHLRKN